MKTEVYFISCALDGFYSYVAIVLTSLAMSGLSSSVALTASKWSIDVGYIMSHNLIMYGDETRTLWLLGNKIVQWFI